MSLSKMLLLAWTILVKRPGFSSLKARSLSVDLASTSQTHKYCEIIICLPATDFGEETSKPPLDSDDATLHPDAKVKGRDQWRFLASIEIFLVKYR